jgi:hypothetical protein
MKGESIRLRTAVLFDVTSVDFNGSVVKGFITGIRMYSTVRNNTDFTL